MSEAAHQPSTTAPEANSTPLEPRDQAPTDTSQENARLSLSSEAVSEFDSSDETLRPSEEIEEEEGSGIDRDVWIDTLPFPDCAPPSPSCSRPQRATEDVDVGRELHASSPEEHGPLSTAFFEAQAERQQVPDFLRDYYGTAGADQRFEDGRRTPPRPPATEALPGTFDQRLFDIGKTGLFYTLTCRNDKTLQKTAVLNLVALQRMVIHDLQKDLAKAVAESFEDGRFGCRFGCTQYDLEHYCKAVRNLDFMTEKAKLGYDKDPFLIKSSRAIERGVLESSGLIPHHVLPKGELPQPEDHENPLLSNESGGRHHANEQAMKKQRLERFAMASFGGLLIIVPMLIMANVPGKVASLVTSCAAIVIFAALVTLGTKLGPHEVLASVAAYAAVLVVFVGLSLEKR